MKKIAVVGAGPKGIAIAMKAYVLRNEGILDIEVDVFDSNGLAANWGGECGYTDGNQILGTAPEKDIGFPYSSEFGINVDQKSFSFSYSNYLVHKGKYGKYIDRAKPHPSHNEFYKYLKWVAKKVDLNVIEKKVVKLDLIRDGGLWVHYRNGREIEKCKYDGIVFTGPGQPLKIYNSEHKWDENIINGRNFWQRMSIFQGLNDSRVAIIGAGETAASITVALIKQVPGIKIDLINRHGTLYTRGESYHENELYTDSKKWGQMDMEDRRDFIRRTDRGVFSVDSKKIIDHYDHIEIISGNVLSLYKKGNTVELSIQRNSNVLNYKYEKVIVAIGFDALSPIDLFQKSIKSQIPHKGQKSRMKFNQVIRENIDSHLRIKMPSKDNNGKYLNIHMPMLASLAQGPGFPNLSCLGSLSDRILSTYVES